MRTYRSLIVGLCVIVLLSSNVYADRVTTNLITLHTFIDAPGSTVILDEGIGTPLLDLPITEFTKVQWLEPGLRVLESILVKTDQVGKLNTDTFFTNGFTVEAWLRPLNNTQAGPARIVTFSLDSGFRNFTLGQEADAWVLRFRSTGNSLNGSSPNVSTPAGTILASPALHHVVATRDQNGLIKIHVNNVEVVSQSIPGDNNWDATMSYGLFNEISYPTDVRTWLGDIYLVAIYDDDLSPSEIDQNYNAGLPVLTGVRRPRGLRRLPPE